MVIKTIPPIPVLSFATQTTLEEIASFTGIVSKQLFAEAVRLDLLPAGPLHWIYTGADGRPATIFTLEIALPVAGRQKQTGFFAYKELPPFECITALHHGAWDHLYETYDRVIDDIHAKGKKPSGYCREQYLFMDFITPFNNLTEVQVGISSNQ